MINGEVEAILFNSSSHWFTIRKIDGIWFNLNSTNSLPGPEIISDFYLEAFILGTVQLGYTNFLIKNLPILPSISCEMYKNLCGDEKRLVPIEDILKAKELKKNKSNQTDDNQEKKEDDKKFKAFQGKGISFNDNENPSDHQDMDEETRKAIEMSLQEYMGQMEKNIKKEPNENDPNCFEISFKTEDKTLTRRFFPDDTIGVNFLKII